jgi:hypothetical protein
MADNFQPILSVLPPPQRRLWNERRGVPEDFALDGHGDCAASGARQSVDFDFSSNLPFEPCELNCEAPAGSTKWLISYLRRKRCSKPPATRPIASKAPDAGSGTVLVPLETSETTLKIG